MIAKQYSWTSRARGLKHEGSFVAALVRGDIAVTEATAALTVATRTPASTNHPPPP